MGSPRGDLLLSDETFRLVVPAIAIAVFLVLCVLDWWLTDC